MVAGVDMEDQELLWMKLTARNLYQFGNMVNCMTNRSRFSYSDYSCWCGAEGKGEPVDEVDKCCKIHDKCYDSHMYTKCFYPFHVYTVYYQYQRCRQCDPISYYPSWEDKVDVECKNAVCECDSAAALCFSQAVYNASYYNYDTSKC
ncbi:basic phospholipase A2 PA-9C-like [Orbicella faveolata]|uniref:basic phospholipase A2 PA-9C-like n=1 Tax=Orbicella faveolata TaxID=48498 RepID=UPI0009E47A76|nr:basic phospholipase A2 PA-9C-like [Orbicella faveolata]